MDQLAAMRVFTRVAELGSFTAAADALDLSRAMVSTQVAGLEKRYGVRLLNRTTRKVALTSEGSRFLDHCRRVFAELQKLGVIVRPMGGYQLPEFIRISIGTPAENERCLGALKKVLDR